MLSVSLSLGEYQSSKKTFNNANYEKNFRQ